MNYTSEQCPIYDGVGSDGITLLRFIGGAFGSGLDHKIRDGYTRISHLYQAADELFLLHGAQPGWHDHGVWPAGRRAGLPPARSVADDATLSNSVQIRMQHDPAYVPGKVKCASGKLSNLYNVVPVVVMEAPAAGSTTA
jgi:hypothetical protein